MLSGQPSLSLFNFCERIDVMMGRVELFTSIYVVLTRMNKTKPMPKIIQHKSETTTTDKHLTQNDASWQNNNKRKVESTEINPLKIGRNSIIDDAMTHSSTNARNRTDKLATYLRYGTLHTWQNACT